MGLIHFSGLPETRLVLGLMSGTSLDGLDMGLFQISGSGTTVTMKQLHFQTAPYSPALRAQISQAFQGSTEEICQLNVELGKFYADQSRLFLEQTNLIGQVHLVGMHGQTLYHIHGHSSLQIGDPSFLAQTLQVPVVYDFRSADIAAGGSGAPLVPYLDQIFLRQPKHNVVLQNLGGIGNLSFVPKDHNQPLIAFDTGPANGILNELAFIITEGRQEYDHNGNLAASGIVNPPLLTKLLEHPYFETRPPKSTGREAFGKEYVEQLRHQNPGVSLLDLMATLTELVAQSLNRSYERFLPQVDQVFLSGGGALNPELVRRVQKACAPIKVEPLPANQAFDSDSKEAAAFALFAHERINQHPTNVPSVTGAKKLVSMGKIAFAD